jgi:hypothetical protein
MTPKCLKASGCLAGSMDALIDTLRFPPPYLGIPFAKKWSYIRTLQQAPGNAKKTSRVFGWG